MIRCVASAFHRVPIYQAFQLLYKIFFLFLSNIGFWAIAHNSLLLVGVSRASGSRCYVVRPEHLKVALPPGFGY